MLVRNNKTLKGSVVDALFIVIIVFALVLLAVLGITTMNTMINNEDIKEYATEENINTNRVILSALDVLIAIIILGVMFLSISLVLYIRVPFGFVGLIVFILPFMLFFANIISGFLKNAITYFNLTQSLSLTYLMTSNLPVLMLILLFVLVILQYSPARGVFADAQEA